MYINKHIQFPLKDVFIVAAACWNLVGWDLVVGPRCSPRKADLAIAGTEECLSRVSIKSVTLISKENKTKDKHLCNSESQLKACFCATAYFTWIVMLFLLTFKYSNNQRLL